MKPARPAESKGTAKSALDANGREKPELKHDTGEMEVILAESYFLVAQDKSTVLYDLRAKRILQRQAPEQAWKSTSLYSDLGFRLAEYQNRVFLGRALAAGGIKAPDMLAMGEPFELQTLFGLVLPDPQHAPPISIKPELEKDGSWIFKQGGAEAAYFKPSQTEMPSLLREMALRWLAYRTRLHPEIRRQIAAQSQVPEMLRTHWANTGTMGTTTLVLQSVSLLDGNAHEPKDAQHVGVNAEGELLALVHASQDANRRALCPSLESASKFADQSVAAKCPLDGLLGLFEVMFQSGDKVVDEVKRLRPQIEKDPQCKRFFAAINQQNKEACKRSVELLRSFDRKGLTKDYILDIHLADALSTLGQGEEAKQLFMGILKRNPFLAGVWNDLGQQYQSEYDMGKAWLCWDLARRIAPQHPMLAGVTRNELRMEHDFPDFFLP